MLFLIRKVQKTFQLLSDFPLTRQFKAAYTALLSSAHTFVL